MGLFGNDCSQYERRIEALEKENESLKAEVERLQNQLHSASSTPSKDEK